MSYANSVWGVKEMNKKATAGIIAIVAIALVAIFAGCAGEKTTVETTPSTTSTDRARLENLIYEHNELFKRTEEDRQKGRKPTYTENKQGDVVTRWKYLPIGALDTIEKKTGDEWTTTAYRKGYPSITVYGKADGDTLRDAYDEITGGVYDFTKNQANVAFIRLYVRQVKGMEISTLQRMLANPTISTDDLAAVLGVAKKAGVGAVPAMVIGYTDTANPNDGNAIYASIIRTFFYGDLYKRYYFDDPNPAG